MFGFSDGHKALQDEVKEYRRAMQAQQLAYDTLSGLYEKMREGEELLLSRANRLEAENDVLRAKLATAEQNRDHWAKRCFETGLDQVQTAQVLLRIAALEKALVAGFETLLPTLS